MSASPSAPHAAARAPHEGRALSEREVQTHEGELRLAGMQCACGFREFPASDTCPQCLAPNPPALTLSSAGTLYSYSTVHIAPPGWQVPYVIGYVDLPEGVRVFGKVAGEASALRPDMPVRVTVEENKGAASASRVFRYHFAPAGPVAEGHR